MRDDVPMIGKHESREGCPILADQRPLCSIRGVIRKILETCISGYLLLETVFVMQAAEDRSGGDSVAIRQSMAS